MNAFKINIQQLRIPDKLFGLIFFLVMAHALYFSEAQYSAISRLRYGLGILIGLFFLLWVFEKITKGEIRYAEVAFSSAHIFLIIYGLVFSYYFGGIHLFANKNFLFFIISIIFGFVLVNCFYPPRKGYVAPNILIAIYVLSTLYLIMTDAISFSPLPTLNLEPLSIVEGRARRYNATVSSYFAIGAFLFFLKSHQYQAYRSTLPWIVGSIFFTYLSMLGGSRGNFVIGLFTIVTIAIRTRSSKHILLYTLGFLLVVYYLIHSGTLYDLVLVNRMNAITGYVEIYDENGQLIDQALNFGRRDLLILQGIELLTDEPFCLIAGCGFNFFQIYNDYVFALYPHNSVIELGISFGLIISALLVFAAVIGSIRLYLSEQGKNAIFYICAYFLLVSLKSGSLVNVTTLPMMLIFAFHAHEKFTFTGKTYRLFGNRVK